MRAHLAVPLLAALVAAAPAAQETLRFDPADGLTLVRTVDSEVLLELEQVTFEINGEIQEPDVTGSQEIFEHLEIADRHEHGEDGLATVRRTLRAATLERSVEENGESDEISEETELLEETVVWRWDDEDGSWWPELEEGSTVDEEYLDELEFELDAQSFLPHGDVEVGDAWTVDADLVNRILSPGGNLGFLGPDESIDDEDPQSELADDALANAEGDVTCELVEVRDDERLGRVAVVAITVSIEGESEFEEELELPDEAPPEMSGDVRVLLSLGFELEGEYVWALERGHLGSLRLEGDVYFEQELLTSIRGTPQGDLEQAQDIEFGGPLTLTFSVAAEGE